MRLVHALTLALALTVLLGPSAAGAAVADQTLYLDAYDPADDGDLSIDDEARVAGLIAAGPELGFSHLATSAASRSCSD